MNYLLEILQSELLFVFIIYKFTNCKITHKFFFTLAVCGIVVLLTSTYYDNDVLNMFMTLITHLLPIIIGIKTQSIKKTLFIKVYCLSLSSLVFSFVFFISSSFKNHILNHRYFEHSICIILIFMIMLLLRRQSIYNLVFEISNMSNRIKIILLIFIWEIVFINTSLSALFHLELTASYKIIISFILFFAILVSFIIVFLLIAENLNNSYHSKYNKMMQEKLTNDAKHIEKLTLATEDLRHLKHDAKNMILGLNAYLDSNDIEGAKEYLESFSKRIEPSKKWIHTGNPFLDSLLSDKYDRLIENNIHIEFDGIMPTESLKPVDICIVFGNALDNAIEACEKLPINIIKNIEISIKQHANALFASISNPISHPVKIHNNTVISTKNTSGHGIGINSMRKIVNSYNGQLVLKSDETKFTVEMTFILEYNKVPALN